jgi:phage-related protein
VKGVNGVKLKTERCGQKWLTTMADVNEFIRQQNETAVSETAVAERDSEKDERLRAAGLI